MREQLQKVRPVQSHQDKQDRAEQTETTQELCQNARYAFSFFPKKFKII